MSSSCVIVGPPLLLSGARRGSMMEEVTPPIRLPLASGDPTGAGVSPLSRLSPIRLYRTSNLVPIVPVKSGPVLGGVPNPGVGLLRATIVWSKVSGPPATKIPPPGPSVVLKAMVL